MTAPASVDELIPAAIELAEREGSVPSKDRLMKTFRIGRPKASEIYRRLQMESAKRRSRRARKLAEPTQKAPFRRALHARLVDPSVIPTSPGMGPVDPWDRAVPTTWPEGLPTSTEGPLPAKPAKALPSQVKRVSTWQLQVIALPAYVAIWAGWVALGGLTGFGPINLLPGIGTGLTINTAITLPIGAEAYAAYALYVWFHPAAPPRARRFAMWSSAAALLIGMGGQVAYHLMASAGLTSAPWQITTFVSCLPVAVLGAAAALVHLVRSGGVKS